MEVKCKEEIKKSVFETNVDTFLSERYKNETTKTIYKGVWQKLIREIEEIKNKELYKFTKEELEALVMSVPTSATARKSNLLTFITIYCQWAADRGLINVSPAMDLDIEKLSKVNKKMLKKNMYSLDYVYRLCQELNNVGNIFQWLPLLLARYGIVGKKAEWIRNLKWNDIDYTHKLVHIIDHESGEILKSVEVDDRFLEIIKTAKSTESVTEIVKLKNKKTKEVTIEFVDYGYVMKKRVGDSDLEDERVKVTDIHNNLKKVFGEANKENITMRNLVKSRKIELLLERRKERRLTGNDVYEVAHMIDPTIGRSAYTSLRRDYESLTKDMVIMKEDLKKIPLRDEKSEEFSSKMLKELFEE